LRWLSGYVSLKGVGCLRSRRTATMHMLGAQTRSGACPTQLDRPGPLDLSPLPPSGCTGLGSVCRADRTAWRHVARPLLARARRQRLASPPMARSRDPAAEPAQRARVGDRDVMSWRRLRMICLVSASIALAACGGDPAQNPAWELAGHPGLLYWIGSTTNKTRWKRTAGAALRFSRASAAARCWPKTTISW
jgi:hypothetical protein